MLATEASSRRRTWVGLAGFLAIEIATFVRYTNIVILGCAVVAVIVAWRLQSARLPLRALCWWLASVAAFGAGVAIFDDQVYGGPLTSGYPPGEVTFGASAIGPNLRIMPAHLMQAMPMLVFGLIALAWIIVRWLVLRRVGGEVGAAARRDLCVALALAASWFAIWGLYSAYTWTTDPTSVTVQVVRFYLPAIGAISLLGAWLVTRIPGRAWRAGLTSTAVIAALFGLGVWAFTQCTQRSASHSAARQTGLKCHSVHRGCAGLRRGRTNPRIDTAGVTVPRLWRVPTASPSATNVPQERTGSPTPARPFRTHRLLAVGSEVAFARLSSAGWMSSRRPAIARPASTFVPSSRNTTGSWIRLPRGLDYAGSKRIHTKNAAKNIDQHGLHILVAEQDFKGVRDLFGIGTAAYIEKVRRHSACILDDVHGRHGKTCAIDHAADVAIELDVVQAVFEASTSSGSSSVTSRKSFSSG